MNTDDFKVDALFNANLFNSHKAVMLIVEPSTGRILDANPAASLFYGWSRDKLRTMNVQDINTMSVSEIAKWLEMVLAQSSGHFEFKHRRADNTVVDVEIWCSRFEADGKELFHSIINDITAHKSADRETAYYAAQFKRIINNIQDAYFQTDLSGKITMVSPSAVAMYGHSSAQEMLGMSAENLYADKNDRKKLLEKLKESPRLTDWVVRGQRIDGTSFWVSMNVQLIRDENGDVCGTEGDIRDISERKNAEEAIRVSEQRFRNLIETSPLAIGISIMGKTHFVNQSYLDLFGYKSSSELLGNSLMEQIAPSSKAYVQNIISKRSQGEETETSYDAWGIRKNGTEFPFHISVARVELPEGMASVAFLEDLTERKRTETALLNAQKMEAMAILAGGIAHDFNNILSAIIGYAEISMGEVQEGSHLRDNLSQILMSADRATDLVRQILSFSRQAPEVVQPVYVQPVMKEVLQLLRASLPSTVDIKSQLQKDTRPILGNTTRIHEIVMNLCVNASHAMAEKGVLTVKHEELTIEEAFQPTVGTGSPGFYSLIEVRDTGSGIPADKLPNIFEPYFTTKPVGEGTGLGLAVVAGVVNDYGGAIVVENNPGQGTTFRIYLPKVSDGTVEDKNDTVPFQGGTERILFIDDEGILCEIAENMLGSLGYRITAISDSLKALSEFKKRPYEYDLIITDQTMPAISGTELAKEFLLIRPEIPILLCTGFSKHIDEETVREAGIRGYCMKPVGKLDLACKIREILDTNTAEIASD